MSTQSLVLRGVIGRRLTIHEIYDNFTYLEDLAQYEQTSISQNAVTVGTGTSLTSSPDFTIDISKNNLSLGGTNNEIDLVNSNNVILGGYCNVICESDESAIIGGSCNMVSNFNI